jgi:hypothetical protein
MEKALAKQRKQKAMVAAMKSKHEPPLGNPGCFLGGGGFPGNFLETAGPGASLVPKI